MAIIQVEFLSASSSKDNHVIATTPFNRKLLPLYEITLINSQGRASLTFPVFSYFPFNDIRHESVVTK